MATLKIKRPCNDCPYRRKSLPGWLGSKSWVSQEETDRQCRHFVDGALADYPGPEDYNLPCHQTIDYSDEDWFKNQYPEATLATMPRTASRSRWSIPPPYS